MLTAGEEVFVPGIECLFGILALAPESTPMKSVDGSGVRTLVLHCVQRQGRFKSYIQKYSVNSSRSLTFSRVLTRQH